MKDASERYKRCTFDGITLATRKSTVFRLYLYCISEAVWLCIPMQGSPMNVQPWWKAKLFVWEPVLFGTWDGVFTTCMINIFGVVLFLRTGWLVVSDILIL